MCPSASFSLFCQNWEGGFLLAVEDDANCLKTGVCELATEVVTWPAAPYVNPYWATRVVRKAESDQLAINVNP